MASDAGALTVNRTREAGARMKDVIMSVFVELRCRAPPSLVLDERLHFVDQVPCQRQHTLAIVVFSHFYTEFKKQKITVLHESFHQETSW